jgi:SAM-dependent methyltransferase
MSTADLWSEGAAYERFMGRWSRRVAVEFVDWLDIPAGLRWLDIGCGTGALTAAVLSRADPVSILGTDPSEAFVATTAREVDDPRAQFVVADAATTPSGRVDVVVAGLVVNFLPDPDGALRAARSAAPQGTVAAYVWDYADGMQMLRYFWDVAVALDPSAASLDEGRRFPSCRPDRLEDLWHQAGLQDVTTGSITIATDFNDFGDYWEPFLGGQGPASSYVASLHEHARVALRERIRAALPVTANGTVRLTARAWAVRGNASGHG